MTNELEHWRESLERRRQARRSALEHQHALQMRRLELLEKVSATVVSAVAPLEAEVRNTATGPVRIRVFGDRFDQSIDFCLGDAGERNLDDNQLDIPF
jgi:hypothetical protein